MTSSKTSPLKVLRRNKFMSKEAGRLWWLGGCFLNSSLGVFQVWWTLTSTLLSLPRHDHKEPEHDGLTVDEKMDRLLRCISKEVQNYIPLNYPRKFCQAPYQGLKLKPQKNGGTRNSLAIGAGRHEVHKHTPGYMRRSRARLKGAAVYSALIWSLRAQTDKKWERSFEDPEQSKLPLLAVIRRRRSSRVLETSRSHVCPCPLPERSPHS